MDTIPELLEVIDSQGWKITSAAHGSACVGCQIQALNAASAVEFGGTGETSYTFPANTVSPRHQATITRKDKR